MTKTDMMVAKTFSARWIMAVMFSLTACIGFLKGKLPSDAFMALVGAAVTAYFSKGPVDTHPDTKEKPNGTNPPA